MSPSFLCCLRDRGRFTAINSPCNEDVSPVLSFDGQRQGSFPTALNYSLLCLRYLCSLRASYQSLKKILRGTRNVFKVVCFAPDLTSRVSRTNVLNRMDFPSKCLPFRDVVIGRALAFALQVSSPAPLNFALLSLHSVLAYFLDKLSTADSCHRSPTWVGIPF